MIIVETCPKCGHDLQEMVIAIFPPIPCKQCWNCGWRWEGKRDDILRIPFQGEMNGNKELTYRPT